VLVTGATGFLGAYLVAALLGRSSVHVECLVRAEDPAHATRRLHAALTWAGVSLDQLARVTATPADLARPRLGLDGPGFIALADRIDEIFHAGALVNLLQPYAAVRASNVGGTHEVLRLAATGSVKPVHHVSTVAVGVAHEDDDPHHDRPLPTGYAASKWVAEMLVHEAASRGIPATVVRTAEVFCDSATGRMNPVDAVHRLLQTCVRLQAIPPADAFARIVPPQWTPVDHVAAAIVVLARHAPPRTYHVAPPPTPLALHAAVLEGARAANVQLDELSYRHWRARLQDLHERDPAACPLGPLAALFLDAEDPPQLDGGVLLNATRTRAVLADLGLPEPPAHTTLLRRYFQAAP
jgi:thioester reductase-like protein